MCTTIICTASACAKRCRYHIIHRLYHIHVNFSHWLDVDCNDDPYPTTIMTYYLRPPLRSVDKEGAVVKGGLQGSEIAPHWNLDRLAPFRAPPKNTIFTTPDYRSLTFVLPMSVRSVLVSKVSPIQDFRGSQLPELWLV